MESDHERIESILVTALEIQSESERLKYLNEACGPDVELRLRVDRLIQNHRDAGSFLAMPTQDPQPSPSAADPLGSKIGPYKLLQKLGEGGMGVVFLAEQDQPVRRRVALKVIRAGMDSSNVLARFEHERQALALMDHPNITRVLDAGATPDGRPFFAMELVHGIPITKYCDQERLSVEDRLRLFIPVCRAVQHAHQKGIIHRDLKPSNIIVGLYDGQPVPKVIDFGVAKATGSKLIDATIYTQVGQVIGTLEYMAPEQAELNNLDIDTRADIYSLGVVLYVLLTGAPPFSAEDLRKAGLGEMLRIIREIEPNKPSTKITNTEDLPRVAANRRLEPARLASRVRGELDWITMKCLEKTRNRRYETANGLAVDLERFLANEPVQACPPTRGYLLRKFARKHRQIFAFASAIGFLLVAATLFSTQQAVRASRAEGRALTEKNEATRQRDEARAQRAHTRNALDAILDPEGLGFLGSQRELNSAQKAFLQRAVKLYQGLAVDASSDREARVLVAQANSRVGFLLTQLGQLTEASTAIQRSIEQFEQLAKEFPEDETITRGLGISYTLAGSLGENAGNQQAMESASRNAIKFLEGRAAEAPLDLESRSHLAGSLRRLGLALREQGKTDQSVETYRRAVEVQGLLATEQPGFQASLNHVRFLVEYGMALQLANRDAESARTFDSATSLVDRILTSTMGAELNPKQLAEPLFQLVMAHLSVGNWSKSEESCKRLIPVWEQRAEEQPGVPLYRLQLAQVYSYLGEALIQQKRWPDAEAALTRSTALYEGLNDSARQGQLNLSQTALAMALVMQGKRDAAQSLIDATFKLAKGAELSSLQVQWSYGLALSGAMEDAIAVANAIAPTDLRKTSQSDEGWSEYALASVYALAAASSPDDGEKTRRSNEALAHLRVAMGDGWADPEYLKGDEDWSALRAHPEFLEILEEMKSRQDESPD
jgi:eukaryotic-like serine/threonine-protein kinase